MFDWLQTNVMDWTGIDFVWAVICVFVLGPIAITFAVSVIGVLISLIFEASRR